jgi:UDP-N-acetylglucosamine--N-acetylmuramyl-(pentapeptide) pyrophosphoryl-undecaprenol N-acetylglucosamine transferase
MPGKTFFFAGGGTGGHIYPAIAVAQKISALDPLTKIRFFISSRDIDKHVLEKAGFDYTILPAVGLSAHPVKLIRFIKMFLASRKIAAELIANPDKSGENPVVIGVGGFVAAPVCWAAHKLKKPVVLLNVDIVPGRANKFIARWAGKIFVQFDETADYFGRHKKNAQHVPQGTLRAWRQVIVAGCPLRSDFDNPNPQKAKQVLGLDSNKKILLITGASSGSKNINTTVCALLEKIDAFADSWQLVHLTGKANFEDVKAGYANAKIQHKVLDYSDSMADLLAAADLVIGRSGAVSVAEYAAAAVPSICMPYPYHSDMHQYLNAGKLVDAGAAVIVDDLGDDKDRREWLWEELEPLLKDDVKRRQMKDACKSVAAKDAALKIAQVLLAL